MSMAEPTIEEYIRKSMESGMAIENIKSSLRQNGWPENEIQQAIQQVQGQTPRPGPVAVPPARPSAAVPGAGQPQQKNKSHKKLIVALIIFLLLFILFVYVAVSIVKDFGQMFPGASSMLPIKLPFTK